MGGAPALVPVNVTHPMGLLDSALRVYGHPLLLRVAETLSGPDFIPFTDNFFCKLPFLGTSTAWHQDPSSGWDETWSEPGFDLATCGHNFHLSVFRSTPETALWMLPGSPKMGRV